MLISNSNLNLIFPSKLLVLLVLEGYTLLFNVQVKDSETIIIILLCKIFLQLTLSLYMYNRIQFSKIKVS